MVHYTTKMLYAGTYPQVTANNSYWQRRDTFNFLFPLLCSLSYDKLVLFKLINIFKFWMPLSNDAHFLLAIFNCSSELSAAYSKKCEPYVRSSTVTLWALVFQLWKAGIAFFLKNTSSSQMKSRRKQVTFYFLFRVT